MAITVTKKKIKEPGYLADTISSSNKKRQNETNDTNNNTRCLTRRLTRKKSSKITIDKNNTVYHDPYGHFNTNNKLIDPYKFFSK